MFARLFLSKVRLINYASLLRFNARFFYLPTQAFSNKPEAKEKEPKKEVNAETKEVKTKPESKEAKKKPEQKEAKTKSEPKEKKEPIVKNAKEKKSDTENKEKKKDGKKTEGQGNKEEMAKSKKAHLKELLKLQSQMDKTSRKGRTTRKTRKEDAALEEKNPKDKKKEPDTTNSKKEKKKPKKIKEDQTPVKTSKKEDKFIELSNYLLEYDPKRMNRRFFSKNFTTDILPTIKFLQEHAKFRKSHFTMLMAKKPKLFVMLEKTDKHKLGEKASLHEVHELFTKEFKFTPRSFKAFLMKYPEIFRYSMEEIKEFLSYAQGVLELTPKEMKRLLVINPMIFNSRLRKTIDDLIKVNEGFIMMSRKDFGTVLATFPFVFELPPEQIKDDIRMLQKYNFNSVQIHKLLLTHAEFLCNHPLNLERCFELVKRFKMEITETVRNIFIENPRLLTICPTSVMSLKVLFLDIFVGLFSKSLKSSEMKLDYLLKVHHINLLQEETFPAILNYNYRDFIRPRGEIMKRNEKTLPWKEVLNLKDDEFCQNLGVTIEELNKVKNEIKESNELDSNKRFFWKYMQNNDLTVKY